PVHHDLYHPNIISSLILSYKSVKILLLRSCSSSTKPSYLAPYCFNDEEKFIEKAGIFRGRDVIGDGYPAGIDHLDDLSSIVKKKGSCGSKKVELLVKL
ncbi:hypothetical protein Tco_0358015, partial [Tanacetum coccineum]